MDSTGGRVDLDNWNPGFWADVRAFAQAAAARGIYVEFDLIDAWVLKTGVSPWALERNVNGYNGGGCDAISHSTLDGRQEAWLSKIATELGGEPNVLFQISNESDVCRPEVNPAWEKAVYDFMKSRTARPVGTNSNNGSVESYVDYIERHSCTPTSLSGKPTGVNEWNCSLSPQQFCAAASQATSRGTHFLLWGDGLSVGEWEEALKCLRP